MPNAAADAVGQRLLSVLGVGETNLRFGEGSLLFLDEFSAQARIRELLAQTDQAKLAVAFWGSGATETLGLDRKELDVEIICNLDSGACNPSEIRKLMKLQPDRPIWSDPRLHGKVYWTSRGAVIGSSNASTNGLGGEGTVAGWAEANVFSDDSGVLNSASVWFEARKAESYQIEEEHLRRAEVVWKERKRSAPLGRKLFSDLGDAVRRAPEHPAWAKVKLAIYSEDLSSLSSEGKKALKQAQIDDPALRNFEAYEDWHKEIVAGDWLLDFEAAVSRGNFTGYLRVPSPKMETKLLTYVRPQTAVSIPGVGNLKLSRADQGKLEKAAYEMTTSKNSRRPPYAMIPIREALAFIDKPALAAKVMPDLKGFERAMKNIYDEAKRAGHTANEFLRMIEREGALPTAKRLILSPKPSSGFTRLWELKRLDLTVEALALQDKWRPLFSATELQRAEQRLGEYRKSS